MLAFVTSMRHPANADNYAHNEALLAESLASISQQTSQDYVVIVVGNQAPAFPLPSRVHFVTVDFAPPARVNGPHADRSGFVLDKGSKIGVGLIAAREYRPDWVMIFDADDFVHRDLTAFVHERSDSDGWVIQDGWIYSRARNGYRKQENFNRTCGTSYILPYTVYSVPDTLDVNASQEAIAAGYGEVLPNIMGAHRNAVQWHSERGRKLRPLPFRGAVYHVDTGENHSGKVLAGLIRPWTPRLVRTYGVRPSDSRGSTLWACLGPTAWWQTLRDLSNRLVARFVRRRASR